MNPLFQKALDADQHYEKTISIQFPGKTRWTLTPEEAAHPEVDGAYRAKVSADAAWLDFLRGGEHLTIEQAKAHLAERAQHGACGLSWAEIERKQGGKLRR